MRSGGYHLVQDQIAVVESIDFLDTNLQDLATTGTAAQNTGQRLRPVAKPTLKVIIIIIII